MPNKIQESELIINPDGSIYHLHLRPEEIADLIITVGDQDRVANVSKHFDRIEHKKQHREFVTHTGFIGNKRLSVISTGIGTDNIDIVLNELDALFNVDFETREIKAKKKQLKILRIGTSGSLQASIPVDSFLASAAALGFDSLMHFYKIKAENKLDLDLDLPLLPYYFKADNSLLELFPNMQKGITATCPGFYAPQSREIRLSPSKRDFLEQLKTVQIDGLSISNFEMETAGIYGLGNLLGHKTLSLNAILANRANGSFSKNPGKTVEQLIQLALESLLNT